MSEWEHGTREQPAAAAVFVDTSPWVLAERPLPAVASEQAGHTWMYMTDRNPHDPGPERPRSEPEVIPPDHSGRRDSIWISVDENGGTRRIYLARPSPFAIIVGLAILALIAIVMLIVLLSVAVIWIPVVIVLVAAFLLTVAFRQYWQRLRNWATRR
jgi:hypothetical protein